MVRCLKLGVYVKLKPSGHVGSALVTLGTPHSTAPRVSILRRHLASASNLYLIAKIRNYGMALQKDIHTYCSIVPVVRLCWLAPTCQLNA